MHIILGATGHVGSAVVQSLLDRGEPVMVVTRSAQKASNWQQKGAQVAEVDVHDVASLHRVLKKGKRLFLLNPPADPSTDTASEERKSVAAILDALEGSGLEKVVALSTYGAQEGEQLGDLAVLYEMEQRLARQPIPTTIIRAAYYLSNWDASLASAQEEGLVYSFYPADFKLPMVAPQDIGELAASLLLESPEKSGLHYIEGPELYSPAQVAEAFGAALNKTVRVQETPREQWIPALEAVGFSPKAAESMANMTAVTLEAQYPITESPERGATSLKQYVQTLVQQNSTRA